MKYAKALGLLAVVVASLMALAGTAMATRATSPTGTLYTGTVKATSANMELHITGITTVKCTHSEMELTIESHGVGVTVFGKLSKLTFTGCTNGQPTSPVANRGSLEVHGTLYPNGEATSNGAAVVIHNTPIGTCIFTTNSTKIGTVTGGKPAQLDVNSAAIPQTGGNPFCPSSGVWTGSYSVTTPGELSFDPDL